jgi:hypothetical protein
MNMSCETLFNNQDVQLEMAVQEVRTAIASLKDLLEMRGYSESQSIQHIIETSDSKLGE